MGVDPSGSVRPNGLDFWWDSFPGNTGNCWWGNIAAPGKNVTTAPLLLPSCADGTSPGSSVGTGDVQNEGELVACLAGFEVVGYPNGDPNTCTWTATPPTPGSSRNAATSSATASRQAEEFAGICGLGLAPRLCAAFTEISTLTSQYAAAAAAEPEKASSTGVTPIATEGPLSLFTCSWWRKADAAHRLGMVQRISHFATMPIDGLTPYGYGAGMSDDRATKLFNSRCSTAYAGPFALYKLYGAAAPFSALVQ